MCGGTQTHARVDLVYGKVYRRCIYVDKRTDKPLVSRRTDLWRTFIYGVGNCTGNTNRFAKYAKLSPTVDNLTFTEEISEDEVRPYWKKTMRVNVLFLIFVANIVDFRSFLEDLHL